MTTLQKNDKKIKVARSGLSPNCLQQQVVETTFVSAFYTTINSVSSKTSTFCCARIHFRVKKAFKTAFLYIGTSIGAGFASGREIALFFGDASPLNVAISSIFMASLCALFLIVGKLDLIPKNNLVQFGIFACASISLVAMLAGGEYVLRSLSNVPLLGLAMAILGGILVVFGIEKIKLANSLLVPLIVLSIALIFSKLSSPARSAVFDISKPILYSGLDVLLGGVIVAEEGKKMSYKQIFASCILIGLFLFAMLFMLQTVVLCDVESSLMPVLTISKQFGLQAVCGVLIATAIFTTLVSSLKLVSDRVSTLFLRTKKLAPLGEQQNKSIVVFLCLIIAYPLSFFGFDAIVDTLYPIISACGVALSAIVTLRLILKLLCKAKSSINLGRNRRHRNRDDTHRRRHLA